MEQVELVLVIHGTYVLYRASVNTGLVNTESKPVNPKGINPEYSLKGLMLKMKLKYFDHLMRSTNSLEKTVMLGKIEGKRRRE